MVFPLGPETGCPEGTIILVFPGMGANGFPFDLSKSQLNFLSLATTGSN